VTNAITEKKKITETEVQIKNEEEKRVNNSVTQLLAFFEEQIKILSRDIEKQEDAFQIKKSNKKKIRKCPSVPMLMSVSVYIFCIKYYRIILFKV